MGSESRGVVRVLRPVGAQGDRSDGDLVRAIRDGHDAAASELARRHARRVYALAFRLVNGPEAEDLAQEAFSIAFERLHTLAEPERFSSWLTGIVVRVVYRSLRRRRIARRLGLVPHRAPFDIDRQILPQAPVEVVEELRAVYALVEQLPVQVRMTLLLHRVDGFGLAEVADHLGISYRTVKRRMAEAERALVEFRRGRRT